MSTRCISCGESTRHMRDVEAALVETHEMCIVCRSSDLAERVAYIRAELRDLALDTDPASGLIPDALEADINQLMAVLKESVR
ncbi:hypothetical protein H5399_05265 [Tessaracoccus sp. MC1627]|uniref:hypothetical protein n=1 Tax=Tessaracoccus sp. MC1627 TaxID=2760312 RepID=UPI0016037147|nr:hypothetical protein [Tessaracoccus sp. MC1627]MBB1512014.1 hypothetical protein [Tessaracoccus sp. MC1627]